LTGVAVDVLSFWCSQDFTDSLWHQVQISKLLL